MGRFKIYDAKGLVKVLSGSNYAECLLCERKLKNIMGNIKRHYEQIHSLYVNVNAAKTKKSRNKQVRTPAPNDTISSSISSSSGIDLVFNCPLPTSKPAENYGLTESAKRSHEGISINNNNNPVNRVKILDPEQNKIKDENKSCSKSNTELKLHIHNSNFKKIKSDEENEEFKIPCHSNINSIQVSLDSCHQVEFLKCLVETKTELNIPLKNFQKGDTFQMALQNWKQNFQFNYSSQTVGEHIDRMAKKLRQEITEMVANKIIYLKLDIASSKESNFMLVNIQYCTEFEMKVITLSALELLDDDLVTYLKKRVLTTLNRFQIDINRVYSITKDNTKNVQEFLECNEDGIQSYLTDEKRNDTSVFPQTNKYCQHLCEQFPGHALHFVASDIIKQFNENICQSRDAVKRIRQQWSQLNIQMPPLLDNTTSWFSVYYMIKSLLNVREIVESNNLEEVDWSFATKFIASFRPVVDTASMLQTNSLFVMGDFYREWLLCEIELEELATINELALYLLEAFRKRKEDFFKNTSFLAALYLDPRFCYMGSMYLNDKQKELAITHLLQIFNKLKEVVSSKHTAINLNDRYSKLENHSVTGLKNNVETKTYCDTISLSNADYQWVKECLEKLQFEGRLPFNTNVLDYWKMAKYKSPILAKIAEVALAAPATQATINRALNVSSIALMKGSKLYECADIIENLLLLRLNQDLVDKITLEK